MAVRLYWMAISHPSQAARKMLECKGVEFELVDVLPLSQRVHLRLAGFRGGTVPALKLDGRRVQGSRKIARVLEERWPEPPLFPQDPGLLARVVEAERWGEEQLQPVPRRIARFGAAHEVEIRRWGARGQRLPAADTVARLSGPLVSLYGRTTEADGRRATEASIRTDLAALPALLAHADALLEDGTLALSPPNAATLQVLSSVRLLDTFADLHDYVSTHSCAQAARDVFPRYPASLPHFLPIEWLRAMIVTSS
jgi:glutathione S-transferase